MRPLTTTRLLWLALALAVGCVQAAEPAGIGARLLVASNEADLKTLLDGSPEPLGRDLFETCRSTAQAAFDRRDYNAAIRGFRAAGAVAERIGSRSEIAASYRMLGQTYRQMVQPAPALEADERGLAALQGNLDSKEERTTLGLLLRGVARDHELLGQTTLALEENQRGVDLFRELNDPQELARSLNNLAGVYTGLGDYGAAGSLFEEAVRVASPWPTLADQISQSLGIIRQKQGNLPAARAIMEKAVENEEKAHTIDALSISLGNLSALYSAMGLLEESAATSGKAILVARETKNISAEAAALVNRASMNRKLGKLDLAKSDLRAALAVLGERQATSAHAFMALSRILAQEGNTEEACADATRANELAGVFQLHEILWQAALAQGECARVRHDRTAERAGYEGAIKELELMRELAGGDEQAGLGYLSDKSAPYERMVRFELEGGNPVAALAYAERAKARQLLDTLRSGKTSPASVLTADESAEERRLSEDVASLNRKLRSAKTAAERAAAQAALDRAIANQENFRSHLYGVHRGLASQRGDAAPVDLASMRELLPTKKTALIEFSMGEKDVYAFVATSGADGMPVVHARTIAVERNALAKEVFDLHQAIGARNVGYRPLALTLYNKLIAPFAADLRDADTLVLVPDGSLWNLPFQALIGPDGTHLIERKAIFYTPSLTYLYESRRLQPPGRATQQLLAFGNPGSANLDNAAAEVRGIAKMFDPAKSLAASGASASKKVWLERAQDYRVLHLATHGILNPENPMFSWLSLAGSKPGVDDPLQAREIVPLQLKADVVVLSACETGEGRIASGEGMLGISWAFLLAGASSTVVSQWSVDSASTTQFMLALYKDLKPALDSGSGRAKALRNAALSVMHNPEYRHPFYWAGFVAVGDGY